MSNASNATNATAATDAPSGGDAERPDLLRPALVLAALGVVFGDIGTSPLYAFRESLAAAGGATPANVLGILSLIFWAITLVVSVKYVSLVLLTDNDGEGGILALLAGVLRQVPRDSRYRTPAIVAGLVGAAMFYGDSVITPAISVLSAVEGLEVVSPQFKSLVIPLTLVILVALFAVQRFGTASMGRWFGPVMVLWFGSLALLGLAQIVRNPSVLQALVPLHGIAFAIENPHLMLAVFGAVFLAVTGGEALYADLGHFGRRPIRVAWFWIVMPALAINYFGQGALVLAEPKAVDNPFFLLAPPPLMLPLVALSAAATVIAAQAVISGAFSLTAQAVRLGYVPRVNVKITSKTTAGQIYVPLVNWALLAVVLGLVLAFGSSSALAAAYGIAVSMTMVITTLGAMLIASRRWGWTTGPRLAGVRTAAGARPRVHGGQSDQGGRGRLVPARLWRPAHAAVHHLAARARTAQPCAHSQWPADATLPAEPERVSAAAGRGHGRVHDADGGHDPALAAAQPQAQPRAARARAVSHGRGRQRAARARGGHGAVAGSGRRLLVRPRAARLPGSARYRRHRTQPVSLSRF
jgi:hypothetical protein